MPKKSTRKPKKLNVQDTIESIEQHATHSITLSRVRVSSDGITRILKALEADDCIVNRLVILAVEISGDIELVVDALAHMLGNSNLSEFIIRKSDVFDDEMFGKIVGGLSSTVRMKKIAFNSTLFGDCGAQALARVLADDTALENIDLRTSAMSDVGLKAVANALIENSYIKFLGLGCSKNCSTAALASQVNKLLAENRCIHSINLEDTPLDVEAATLVSEGLKDNNGIRSVNVSNSSLDDQTLNILMEGFYENKTIKSIILNGNTLSPSSLKKLVKLSTVKGIEELHLNSCMSCL